MTNGTLCLHAGAKAADFGQLFSVPTPEATATWTPIPHAEFVSGIRETMTRAGLVIKSEEHALAKGGARYFGLLHLQNRADYNLTVGLRNSHDKSFPAGLAVGSRVFVCDNLAFSGEVKIGRKHTTFIRRDLPGLIGRAIGRVNSLILRQDLRIDSYKRFEVSDASAHDVVVQALDARVVPVTRIPEVLKEWRTPRHPEFAQAKNGWRLFNAFTEALKGGNVFRLPGATEKLHGLMDTVCGVTMN